MDGVVVVLGTVVVELVVVDVWVVNVVGSVVVVVDVVGSVALSLPHHHSEHRFLLK